MPSHHRNIWPKRVTFSGGVVFFEVIPKDPHIRSVQALFAYQRVSDAFGTETDPGSDHAGGKS